MPTGKMIHNAARIGIHTAQTMLEGIKPDRFARLPLGQVGAIPTNHPAWAYGHLALYAPNILRFLGDEAAAEQATCPDNWKPLFGMGSTCQDDPDGTIYPPMKTIVDRFTTGYDAAMKTTKASTASTFEQIFPDEPHRERFPTVGTAVTFMLTTHLALHIGQVSAWRRIEGLGSALKF